MEVRYRREMNHNYMIIDAPAQELGYECRMLAGNHIEGLLKFRVRYGEEKREFYYEITSRQPLRRVLEKRKASGEEIQRLLLTVVTVMRRIEEYLLPEEQLLLDPDFLYVEPDSFDVKLCLLPGRTSDWAKELSSLLQYLLEQADPQDKDALVLAYHLYQESLKDNYGAADLMKYLASSEPRVSENRRSAKEEKSEKDISKSLTEEFRAETMKTSSLEVSKGEPELPQRKWEEKESSGTAAGSKKSSWKLLRSGLLLLFGVEAVLWYFRGMGGLRTYGIFPILGFSVLLTGSFLAEIGKKGSKNSRSDHKIVSEEQNPSSWELQVEREEDHRERVRRREEEEMKKSREDGTVLLADLGEVKGIGRLDPLERDAEAIEISYVPFIIGKHPQLTDYCLLRPTVSRLHLRIDQKENVCIITDLNSTNGTSVNGYTLQANETVSVKTGDIIYLADMGFRFYERG